MITKGRIINDEYGTYLEKRYLGFFWISVTKYDTLDYVLENIDSLEKQHKIKIDLTKSYSYLW